MQRSRTWGFPRWSGYGRDREPETVRLCDHAGCGQKADYPAPKSPHSSERWWFCLDHVTAYNKEWNYFAGLSAAQAERLAREEAQRAKSHQRSSAWSWTADSGEYGTASAARRALHALELEDDAGKDDIKRAYRRLAKRYHPDTNAGDEEAARRFREIRGAYDFLMARL
ncbi:MAG: J domain-containing protein [Alphaproteobacteria bacterium]|nr:MAG: J domain-containing protein [Alphaproteobacteria bacterium]